MTIHQIDENGITSNSYDLPNDADTMEILVTTNPNPDTQDPMGLEEWTPYEFQRNGPIRILKMHAWDRWHIQTWLIWSTDGSEILSWILRDYEDAFNKAE